MKAPMTGKIAVDSRYGACIMLNDGNILNEMLHAGNVSGHCSAWIDCTFHFGWRHPAMKKVRGSSPATAFVLLFGIAFWLIFLTKKENQMLLSQHPDAKIAIYGLIGLLLSMFIPSLHILYVGPDGITHKWLGICYKKTPWTAITNVSRIYMGKRGATFWVTSGQVEPLRPHDDGTLPDTLKISLLWIGGSYFTLLNNNDIMAYIEQFYGPLDFDCIKCAK